MEYIITEEQINKIMSLIRRRKILEAFKLLRELPFKNEEHNQFRKPDTIQKI